MTSIYNFDADEITAYLYDKREGNLGKRHEIYIKDCKSGDVITFDGKSYYILLTINPDYNNPNEYIIFIQREESYKAGDNPFYINSGYECVWKNTVVRRKFNE